MKKIMTLALAAAVALGASAQAKVQTQEAMDYQRSSVTVVPAQGLTHGHVVKAWADTVSYGGDKFDHNNVSLHVSAGNTADSIQAALHQARAGKHIVNYWLQYDGKKFDQQILEQRSRYNATDADVLRDQASKVSMLFTNGKPLMKNSYIVVANPLSIKEKVDKKGNKTYAASVATYVYRVALNDTVLDEVWGMWLDDESTEAAVAQWEATNFDVEYVSHVTMEGSAKSPEAAVVAACDGALEKLEQKIEKWQVVTSVYQIHPLRAKIGTKEGVRNSDRYAAYKVIEDQDGNLSYKRMAYVRATQVANNTFNAEGESPTSKFYQITGRTNVKEGYFLKQKKDARSSISLSGNLWGYAPVMIDYDYLVHTSQSLGMMQYAGVSLSGDFGKLGEEGQYWLNTTDKQFWASISVNYGLGIHFSRFFELTPNIGIGVDYCGATLDGDSDEDDSSFAKRLAYYGRGGVKFGFQICYAFQVFVRADYSYRFSEGDWYFDADRKRFNKLSAGIGLKYNF